MLRLFVEKPPQILTVQLFFLESTPQWAHLQHSHQELNHPFAWIACESLEVKNHRPRRALLPVLPARSPLTFLHHNSWAGLCVIWKLPVGFMPKYAKGLYTWLPYDCLITIPLYCIPQSITKGCSKLKLLHIYIYIKQKKNFSSPKHRVLNTRF